MRIKALMCLFLTLAVLLTGCGKKPQSAGEQTPETETADPITVTVPDTVEEDSFSDAVTVTLSGNSASADGGGVEIQNDKVKITGGGYYRLTGNYEGQIHVKAEGQQVNLLLDGVAVTNDTDAAIRITRVEGVNLVLAAGTVNSVTDTDVTSDENADRENAALYAKCSINIGGSGSLAVSGAYNHGIFSQQVITVREGTLTVDAENAGIKGEAGVAVSGGAVNIKAGGDGIKNSSDKEMGYILLSGGTVTVESEQDGISATLNYQQTGGDLKVTTTGYVSQRSEGDRMGGFFGGKREQQTESESTEISSKGVKAGSSLEISGGTVQVSSTGHCLHSSGSGTVRGGTLNLTSSAGKGIATHGELNIENGEIEVARSTEALESKTFLNISGGTTRLVASDDGINAAGTAADSTGIHITGGYLYMDTSGDGIDSNGDCIITGGTVIVAGPLNGANGAIDASEGTNRITGGMLIACGTAGMAECPGEESTQNVLMLNVSVQEGELFCLQDSSGTAILTLKAQKAFSNIVVSLPALANGDYTYYTGGSCSGEEQDGLYVGGSYEGGTLAGTVTISSVVTGSTGGMGGMGGMTPPGGGMGGGQRPGGMMF